MLKKTFYVVFVLFTLTACESGSVKVSGNFDPNDVKDAPLIDRRSEFGNLARFPTANVTFSFNRAFHTKIPKRKGYFYTIQFDSIMGIPGSSNISYKKHKNEFVWKTTGAQVDGRHITALTPNMGRTTISGIMRADGNALKSPMHVYGAIPIAFAGDACTRETVEKLIDNRIPKIKKFLMNAIERQTFASYAGQISTITPFYNKLSRDLEISEQEINNSLLGCGGVILGKELDSIIGQHIVFGFVSRKSAVSGLANLINNAIADSNLSATATAIGVVTETAGVSDSAFIAPSIRVTYTATDI
ncbi:MAG: hypothetical protein ACRBCI_07145 [Cellvibrionaceae bacterium]